MMTRERLDELRAIVASESISYGECIEIDDAFAETAKAKRLDEEQPVMADDKLDVIEEEMNDYGKDALAVFGDVTIRTLLIDLHFNEATQTADGEDFEEVRSTISETLSHEELVDFDIVQVYPGDIVHWDAVPDVFDLDLGAALREAGNLATRARAALNDEHEGDLRENVDSLLDLATKLARFVGAM